MSGDTPDTITTLSTAYALALWYVNGQGIVQCTLPQLVTYLEANMTLGKQEDTWQYSTPLTGANVQVTDGDDNIFLLITPAGTLATLTITFPTSTNMVDKQEITVLSTQIISALTLDDNGASGIVNGPSALTANQCFKVKYNAFYDTYYTLFQ